MGAKIVAPKSASLTLGWLMPMLTDYGIYPPRPVDIPLPLARVGDETDFEVSGVKFHALFVPGHSFDLTIYMTELAGKRIAFTGDLGFETRTSCTAAGVMRTKHAPCFPSSATSFSRGVLTSFSPATACVRKERRSLCSWLGKRNNLSACQHRPGSNRYPES